MWAVKAKVCVDCGRYHFRPAERCEPCGHEWLRRETGLNYGERNEPAGEAQKTEQGRAWLKAHNAVRTPKLPTSGFREVPSECPACGLPHPGTNPYCFCAVSSDV